MRIHLHPRRDDEGQELPVAPAAWWGELPAQVGGPAPVIHAARAAELLAAPVPVVLPAAHPTAA